MCPLKRNNWTCDLQVSRAWTRPRIVSINHQIMDTFNPGRPYQRLPLLPPAVDIESKAVLKACIEARTALSELRVAGELIPNQAVLINSIPLLEAQASSEIENIVTTADKLFQHAGKAGDESDGPTKEAFRYRTALYQGFRHLSERPLSTATCVEVCRTIKGVELDNRKTPGTKLENKITVASTQVV